MEFFLLASSQMTKKQIRHKNYTLYQQVLESLKEYSSDYLFSKDLAREVRLEEG